MTKRTLFIIIGLLVLLNIAAIIIYLSAPNREGKSPLDLSLEKSNEPTPGDSAYNAAATDEFVKYNETANYLSTDKVQDGNEQKRMSASIIVKLQWPKEINHSAQFMQLQNALMTKLTGKTYADVKTMIKSLTGSPKFVRPTTRYTRVNTDFSSSNGASHTTHRYTVQPHFSTLYRLEMEVFVDVFDGKNTSRTTYGIVHYDRVHGKVLTIDDIFSSASTANVVALINQSIRNMRQDNDDQISEISSIPREFVLGKDNVFFYVAQRKVTVSNKSLNPYFTEFYRELLSHDTSLATYDKISQ